MIDDAEVCEPQRRSARDLSAIVEGRWEPQRTGHYAADCERGRAYAEEMLALIDELQNPLIFGAIVRAITGAGRFEAVEIGFCHRIGMTIAVRCEERRAENRS